MVWIPDLSFALHIFELLKTLPECKDLENATCINPSGIEGVLNKVLYGIPFQKITFWMQCAILIHDIISYHYFSDGNKRIGFLLLLVFLKKNNYSLQATEDEKVDFALKIAQGFLSNEEIALWIEKRTIKE